MSLRVAVAICVLTVCSGHSVTAQSPDCAQVQRQPGPKNPPDYPMGTIPKAGANAVDSLRCFLRSDSSNWAGVSRLYFGSTYVPSLPDLIVYIDTAGTVHQHLVQNDGEVSGSVLRGEKFVYVIVFYDQPVGAPAVNSAAGKSSERGDTVAAGARIREAMLRAAITLDDSHGRAYELQDSVRVVPAPDGHRPLSLVMSRTSIDYQGDPALTRLVYGLLSKLSISIGSGISVPEADSQATATFDSLGIGAADSTSVLFVTFHRFALTSNTWNRVDVKADPAHELPKTKAVVANFANADASYFGLGMGTCLTFNAHTLSNDSLVGQQYRLDVYLLAHLFVLRPELPRHPTGISLVMGTNLLDGSLLNDVIFGLSIDRISFPHLKTDAGVVFGVNLLSSQRINRSGTRLFRPFAGVDFPL